MNNDPSLGLVDLSRGGVRRRPMWLDQENTPTLAWLHEPANPRSSKGGVVLCPSFGFEYAHAHRTLVHAADRLASAGHIALRFDYPGTGDAVGNEETKNLFEAWTRSVEIALDAVDDLAGGGPPSLVGLRLGALLGGVVAQRRELTAFVAWAPVVRGRRYMRELRAHHQLAAGPDHIDDRFLEAAGFRISEETAERIGTNDLAKMRIKARRALIVDRTDQPCPASLLTALSDQGIPTAVAAQADYLEMMAEPHFTVVPEGTIQTIVDWMDEGGNAGAADMGTPRPASKVQPRSVVWTETDGQQLREDLVLIPSDDGPLFGVMTEPVEGTPSDPRVVIMPNAGSVHHAGPNRLYVEAARLLAASGISSIRLDLRGLGDSCIDAPPQENHPYPDSALDDLRLAADWLAKARGKGSAIVAGLCSGAHAAFHAGLECEDRSPRLVILINPLTFYYQRGGSLETPASLSTAVDAMYYGRAARNPASWMRLVRGRSDVIHVVHIVVRRTIDRLMEKVRLATVRFGLREPSRLARDLGRLRAADQRVHFIFSDADPGLEILRGDAPGALDEHRDTDFPVTVVRKGDHTFSRSAARRVAIRAIIQAASRAENLSRTEVPAGPGLWGSVGPVWAALLDELEETSAFMSSEWVGSWVESYAKDLGTTGLIWTTADGRPVACALVSRSRIRHGPVTLSAVALNASGATGHHCEDNDILILRGYRSAVMDDLTDYLSSVGMDEVSLEGARRHMAEELLVSWGCLDQEIAFNEAPLVDLELLRRTGRPYAASLSRNTRAQIMRSRRRYEQEHGTCAVEVAHTPQAAQEWFDEMLRLHDLRFETDGSRSGFTAEARSFHRDLLTRHAANRDPDRLRPQVIRVRFGEYVIGFIYYLAYRADFKFFSSGFRYDADPHLKPGLVAHTLILESLLRGGANRYDFLGGDAVQYKRSLSTGRTEITRGTLSNCSARARGMFMLRRLKRRLAD